ncbi:IS3 family transposase, partial [Pseudomonas syringae]
EYIEYYNQSRIKLKLNGLVLQSVTHQTET